MVKQMMVNQLNKYYEYTEKYIKKMELIEAHYFVFVLITMICR